MRELDLETNHEAHAPAPGASPVAGANPAPSQRIAIIGRGRAGTTFATGLDHAGHQVVGPLGRGEPLPADCDVVMICVPDGSIAEVVDLIPEGPLLAHCCGAHGVELLSGRRGFCIHPLMTLDGSHEALTGSWAAIDATDSPSRALATSLASDLGMEPVQIGSEDRAAYHAAAAIASNFLITLEAAAERLAASAGLPRESLAPLVERTVTNWKSHGARSALTGPVARGDDATVAAHRAAIADRAPDLLELFDALRAATERLAAERTPA